MEMPQSIVNTVSTVVWLNMARKCSQGENLPQDLGVSDLGVSDLGVLDLGVSDLGVSLADI